MRDSKQPGLLADGVEEAKAHEIFDIGTTADVAQSHKIKKDILSNPPDDIEIDIEDDDDDYS